MKRIDWFCRRNRREARALKRLHEMARAARLGTAWLGADGGHARPMSTSLRAPAPAVVDFGVH